MIDIKLDDLTFEKASEYFKGKIPVNSRTFYRIKQEYKTKAFTISGYNSTEILKKFMDTIQSAIDNGTTMDDFKKEVDSFLEKKGYEGLTPFQADNIFRTNIQTAYSVGHYQAMTDETVKELRPYWQYDAVLDSRTRETHRALNGKVFPADHPFWDTWYPPNGFRCRCGVITLSEEQVKARGLKIETKVPRYVDETGFSMRPLVPDRGFNYNPAKQAFNPDIDSYPEPLKKAYKKYKELPNG